MDPNEGEAEAARKEAEQRRRDRERAARAAEREAERARRDAAKDEKDREKAERQAARDREKARQQAERDAARAQAERERSVREAEKEAARAHREAEKAALDAALAQQRAARQVDRARREAERAGLLPALPSDEHGASGHDGGSTAPEARAVLPRELAILWRTPEPNRRGPRPGLTVEGIAASAIALADAEGLSALSMARVAESLGVTTMALYRYVSGKDELLAVMTDLAIGPPPPPDDGGLDWRESLDRWCRAQIALSVAHPWIVQTAAVVPLPGPNRLAWMERGMAALRGVPLSEGLKGQVFGALALHVLSESRLMAASLEARRQSDATARTTGGSAAGHAEHPALVDYGTLLRMLADPAEHPAIVTALEAGAFDDPAPESMPDDSPHGTSPPDDSLPVAHYDVGFGLSLLLDGIAALIEQTTAGQDPTARRRDEGSPP